ncbi:MAG TPA: helix-turn-helix transcriptional regulator [Thermoanaerobaculia bacterium]|nr:helix-turn-helix transcriptional regulator [Thermoanaerobaculia bacterium]
MSWLRDDNLLPHERIVYRSSVVAVGRFRCGAGSRWFRDSGPIANHVFVFPRLHVRLSYSRGPTFIASPNVVTLYNRGQEYSRAAMDRRGDDCDWFAVAPDVLAGAVGGGGDPGRPFSRHSVFASAGAYARARSLVRAATENRHSSIDEDALALLDEILPAMRGTPARSRQTMDRVEAARDLLRRDLDRPLRIRNVAERTGTSVFHLCRIFREATGYSLHAYRQQLRLRASLEKIRRSDDLLETAVSLGFNSHSHFTAAFRKAFGVTPSVWRYGQRPGMTP